jgi:hypothetical protein
MANKTLGVSKIWLEEELNRWEGDFLWGQWFLALLNNGENRGLGVEAFWFQPKQLFSDCSAIERH